MNSTAIRMIVLLVLAISIPSCMGQTKAVNSNAVAEESPEAALEADLQEAISMLDKKQFRLLMYDFFPPAFASRRLYESRSPIGRRSSSGATPIMSDPAAKDLKSGLEAALAAAKSGDVTFNRKQTLVEITYVKKAVELVPATSPAYVLAASNRPKELTSGLGRDLKKMLQQAATLLKDGKQEEFIRSVYPLPELANLDQADNMPRLLSRLKARPEMTVAMIADLKAAGAQDFRMAGTKAEVTLPNLSNRHSGRVLKFELVDDNWRFPDSGKPHRELYRKMASAPIGSHVIPGSRGVLVLYRLNGSWRMREMPIYESVDK